MTVFNMPASGTWEQRGGWVVNALVRDFSLAIHQAAGLVGNLGFESIGFTAHHEIGQAEGRGGYGWAQWTADRRVSFLNWCADNKLSPQSDRANYGYLVWELQNTHKNTVTALLRCSTLEQAVFSVGQTFERPAGTTATFLPGYDDRLEYAQRALDGAGSAPSTGPVVTPAKTVLKGNADIVFSWVQGMQHYLIDTGYLNDKADGIAGAKFQDAIARFQRDHPA